MKNAIRNLLLAACVLFAASFDSCTMGVEYDKRHKLHPETSNFSDCSITPYRNRWEDFGLIIFILGVTSCFAAFAIRGRREHSEDLRRSIISAES